MDPNEQKPVSQPVSQPLADPEQPKSSPFKIIEISLLEALFVIVILSLLLGILNFFNIIPLSSKISFISFLPHQQPRQVATVNKQSTFLYDVNSANKQLTDFVHNSLNASYLPSSPSAELFIKQKDNSFQGVWFVGDTSINASFSYTPKSNSLSYKVISLSPVKFSPPTHTDGNNNVLSLAGLLFTHISSTIPWKCQQAPSSPSWSCIGIDHSSSLQKIYSFQRYIIDTNTESVSAQTCELSDTKLLDPHPELGCLGLFNKN